MMTLVRVADGRQRRQFRQQAGAVRPCFKNDQFGVGALENMLAAAAMPNRW
jgi:hypothetical protein